MSLHTYVKYLNYTSLPHYSPFIFDTSLIHFLYNYNCLVSLPCTKLQEDGEIPYDLAQVPRPRSRNLVISSSYFSINFLLWNLEPSFFFLPGRSSRSFAHFSRQRRVRCSGQAVGGLGRCSHQHVRSPLRP